jgi:hypothetical protein
MTALKRRHHGVGGKLRLLHVKQRDEHRAIGDVTGKAAQARTIPMPDWVKEAVDDSIRNGTEVEEHSAEDL